VSKLITLQVEPNLQSNYLQELEDEFEKAKAIPGEQNIVMRC